MPDPTLESDAVAFPATPSFPFLLLSLELPRPASLLSSRRSDSPTHATNSSLAAGSSVRPGFADVSTSVTCTLIGIRTEEAAPRCASMSAKGRRACCRVVLVQHHAAAAAAETSKESAAATRLPPGGRPALPHLSSGFESALQGPNNFSNWNSTKKRKKMKK